jgi:hypothetical protein
MCFINRQKQTEMKLDGVIYITKKCGLNLNKNINMPSLLFISLCQLGQGHHNSICQLLWALFCLPNPPCQLSLWEETGVPGGNPRLLAER